MSPFWLLVGIVALGLMVLVHEWGHFVVAKLLRVRVEVFSIGFGPRLFGRRRGDTDYRVSALPLGGYVKMAGDNPTAELAGAPDEFLSKPRWQRVLIVLAGPTTNLLMAVVLLAGVFSVRYERAAFLDEPAGIGAVVPDSAAARAGLQAGDRVVSFGRAQNPTWENLLIEASLVGEGTVGLEVERGGSRVQLSLDLPAAAHEQPWEIGWVPDSRPAVQSVQPGGPADRAGLRAGDVLLALDGEPLRPSVSEENPLSRRLQELAGKPAVLTVERGGTRQEISVTPIYGDHPQGKRWLLGVTVGERMARKDLTVVQAVEQAVVENVRLGQVMLGLVGRLFTGRASLKSVTGPVGIVRFSGEVGQQGGWLAVLNLMAAISLSLGLLNLLPIPILDGGHIAMLAIEGVRRRDLSVRFKERIMQAGFVFLMLVFAWVMYNDIGRIFRN